MHYDVFSFLNPRYQQTQMMGDYYGIYNVVEVYDDGSAHIVATFDSRDGNDNRNKAYEKIKELIWLKRLKEETGL